MINRSQIEKMLMASGGITGDPVLTAKLGSYAGSTGGGRGGPAGMTTTERKRQAPVVKSNIADRQLDNLVNKSRKSESYRNFNNAYTPGEVSQNNLINLTDSQKKFVERNRREDGSFNSAAQALINNSGKGFVVDNGKAVIDNVTSYQRDLQNFRAASPANEAAYVKRFPKTAALQSLLAKGTEGLLGLPGKIIKQAGKQYLDGVQNMIEKISGVDAKNVEIAKNKDTDIKTIVDNLSRNIKKERDDGKARGMTEADLTAMYGDPIDTETGDDIFGADLIGMDLLEEDSPLNVAQTEGIAQSEAEQKELEGGTQTQGLTPIRLDRTLADDENLSLFDLAGSDEPGKVSPFALDTEPGEKKYFDLDTNRALDPSDIEIEQEDAAFNLFSPGILDRLTSDETNQLLSDQYRGQKEFRNTGTGFPDIDVTQEGDFLDRRNELTGATDFTNRRDSLSNRDLVNNPIEGQATMAGKGLVYTDGTPIMEQRPTPLFESEMLDDETIRKAIEGKADGGQIFGNQNMSTFDKLKAIADGIADNK